VCKKSIKNSQPFVKKMKNVRTPQGGFFLTHTVYVYFVFFFVFWGLFSFVASPSVL